MKMKTRKKEKKKAMEINQSENKEEDYSIADSDEQYDIYDIIILRIKLLL